MICAESRPRFSDGVKCEGSPVPDVGVEAPSVACAPFDLVAVTKPCVALGVRRTGFGAMIAIVVVEPSGKVDGVRIETTSTGDTAASAVAPFAVAAPFVGETKLFTPTTGVASVVVGELGSVGFCADAEPSTVAWGDGEFAGVVVA